jgi:hypothetical protein
MPDGYVRDFWSVAGQPVPDAAKGLTTRAQTVAGTCGTLPLRAFGA